ncbi:MarR family winged helix-turn-helix transcriptional regulator [Microbispora sp. CA-102843]|uniref:MarR family winged helix-turn-helix transcriptional regulator n=1 Tax=Microbispora sp. CA-102843 TaxID=3239952 RepID=UPI003D8C55C8
MSAGALDYGALKETDPALEEDAWSVEDASLALVEMTLNAATRGSDLSVTQLRVLLAVDRHGPLNLSGLAALLGMSVSATGRLVARLHTAGLLTRLLSPHSRREVSIDVSETGRRSLERIRAARRGHIAAALRHMPADSRRTLARTLRELTAAAGNGLGEGGRRVGRR